jgi:NADH-quinone oxidoreductase subunit E
MTVRRLAAEEIQPPGFAFSPENQAWAEVTITKYPPGRQQSAVIPLLMRAQDQEGWVSRPAIEAVAKMLDMAYIRVLEVATFYTQFQLKPVGTSAHIQVCGTTPCMLRGAEALIDVCRHKIHHDPFTTNDAGTMSWEEVECLGACVNAPMVMIGKDTYEDLTAERFEEIVDAFAAGKGASIKPGPQIVRQFSAAEGGPTTLLEQPTAERTYRAFPPPPQPTPAQGAAPAAAPAVVPATPPTAPAAAAQEPTMPGRKLGEVPAEVAPAVKEPRRAPKVSEQKAEAARKKFSEAAGATGEPNKAMREDAVGPEAEGGKRDTGAAPGKDKGGG